MLHWGHSIEHGIETTLDKSSQMPKRDEKVRWSNLWLWISTFNHIKMQQDNRAKRERFFGIGSFWWSQNVLRIVTINWWKRFSWYSSQETWKHSGKRFTFYVLMISYELNDSYKIYKKRKWLNRTNSFRNQLLPRAQHRRQIRKSWNTRKNKNCHVVDYPFTALETLIIDFCPELLLSVGPGGP